jgi:hypothetical protein
MSDFQGRPAIADKVPQHRICSSLPKKALINAVSTIYTLGQSEITAFWKNNRPCQHSRREQNPLEQTISVC